MTNLIKLIKKQFLRRIIAILIIIAISITFLATTASEERFKPSNINTRFDFDITKDFEEYITYSKNIIESARVDLNKENKEQIIAWNSPFIMKPDMNNCSANTKGILLIHGLSDSPYSIKASANYFKKKCFIVYSILLAGHGTRPGDLLDVSYKDWIKQINYAVKELSKETDDIYLLGFSTGATLAINYVLSNPAKKISGIFLLSPAINLPSAAAYAQFIKIFKKWHKKYDDKDIIKYESSSVNSIAQIYLLTKEINNKLKDNNQALLNTKVFAAISYDDKTINPVKSLNTLLAHTNDNNRHIVVYHQNPLPKDISNQKGVYPLSSYMKKDRILGITHISLPYSAKDIWYGAKAQYRNCLHYYKSDNYDVCKKSSNIYEGVISKENLNNVGNQILARLTYNPLLDDLFKDSSKFFGFSK